MATYKDNTNVSVTSTTNKGGGKNLISKKIQKFQNKPSKFINKIPNNSNKVVDLYNTFGKDTDNIELNIYDSSDILISHIRDFKNYTFSEEGSQSDGTTNEVIVNPEQDLRNLNFNSGQYKVEYRFQRKKIINNFIRSFSIEEISNSRNEIRIYTSELTNIQLEQRYNIFNDELSDSSFFKDFTLNFGNGVNVTAVNIFLDKSDDNYSLLIKLLDPLPLTIANTFTLRIAEDLIEPAIITLNLETLSVSDNIISIAGPNFKIDTRLNSSIPSEFKTYDELLGGTITSSYQNVLNSLSSSFEPNVEYNNLSTDSGYHFENFVHFSSATERLNNFKYKIKLLELYDRQISNINTIVGNASSSVTVLGSKNVVEIKKKKVIGGFDGYERFLYYESGTYSWPKQSLNKPYVQYATTSSQGLEWFGSNKGSNPNYGGQIYSSSQFDDQNVYNLNKLIPEYIKNDSNNNQYKLFIDMIGQHFDQSWLYIKSLTENKRAENKLNRGIDKNLVYNALKGLGIQVFDEFENEDLFGYLTGINKDGTLLHQTGSGITLITASNGGSLPKADITKEKWKRIYHNLPYLLKTKGTERGIKALITSYGIPSTILNVKEFGGSTTDKTTYKTFTHDRFSYALTGDSGTEGFFIKTNWSASDTTLHTATNALTSSAKTVEFRIKPYRSNEHYHLFSLITADNEKNQHLFLQPYTGSDIESFGDSIQYGRLIHQKFTTHTTATEYFPIYNGDFWNIHIGVDAGTLSVPGTDSTGSFFGAYQANHLKTVNYYKTSSAPILVAEQGEVWGLKNAAISDGTEFKAAGADFCFIGGLSGSNLSPNPLIGQSRYSGSIQEIRFHFGELLSHDTLVKHALQPSMYAGNHISSSYSNLLLRLPLGGNLSKTSQSFHLNSSIDYLSSTTSISSSITQSNNFIGFTETTFLTTPDTVGKSMTSEKVRLDSGDVEDNILSYDVKTETSVLDRQPTDSTDLGVYFSPSYEINKDIINHLGSFRLDDYIGDPTHISQNSYPDLTKLSNEYFKKSMDRFKFTDFIDLTKQFDHTLFKMIESMVPAKVNLKTGILIEPHYLERSKFGNPSTLPGVEKHNNYEVEYNIKPTSDNSNFNLSGQNLLTEVEYNIKPESEYVSFDANSNFLLNNAISSRKSKKYFKVITSKTEEF